VCGEDIYDIGGRCRNCGYVTEEKKKFKIFVYEKVGEKWEPGFVFSLEAENREKAKERAFF